MSSSESHARAAPARWLVEHIDLIAPAAAALDVASGTGRHALYVAQSGRRVHAIDRDAAALAALSETARAGHLPISTEVLDLETDTPPRLGRELYGAVLVFNYLHRPLWPSLLEAIAPGGVLIYETFLHGLRNPAFMLAPGELRRLAAPLSILHWREGEFDGRTVASIVARKQ